MTRDGTRASIYIKQRRPRRAQKNGGPKAAARHMEEHILVKKFLNVRRALRV